MNSYFTSAPGRCGIIGNPSDIYGGVVTSASIPARNRCILTVGEAGPMPEDLRLWNAIMARFPISQPVSLKWETNVPRSSGLSGSTAMLAATLLCVLAARGEAPTLNEAEERTTFAELVRDIERNEAQIVCGFQDAYMIAHGGVQRMSFLGKHPEKQGPAASLLPLETPLPFLLITTGVERLSGSVHGPMAQRWLAGEPAVVTGMKRIAELGNLGAVALTEKRYEDLATMMTENQTIIAGLGGSGDAIDTLISDGMACGAMAVKLAGAGLGGTVIALTEDPDDLQKCLSARGYSRFMQPINGPGVGFEAGVAV